MPTYTNYQLNRSNYKPYQQISRLYPTDNFNSETSAAAAIKMILEEGPSYARASAPTSQNPEITANKLKGISVLSWLKGKNKCNVFVGEALYRAGFEMPTYKMADGSHHYVNAEALPKMKEYFTPITNKQLIQKGDLLIIDKTNRRGENGAHVELITVIDSARKYLKTASAHEKGAYETDNSYILKSLPEDISSNNQLGNWASVYFLRPIKALVNPMLP